MNKPKYHYYKKICCCLLFDEKKVKMKRKPGKKQKDNPVGCTGKVEDVKKRREEHGEDKTGTACV